MKNHSNKDIKQAMKRNLDSCRDYSCNELNYTLLAETTCHELDGYVGDDIPEIYFELAIDFD